MRKTKITSHQLFSLTANASFGGSVIVIASTLARIAKQDAWIGALLTPVFGIAVIWVYWFLGSRYPGATFVEILRKILGRWLGSIAAASYALLWLTTAYHLPWYIGNFIKTQAMPETPAYIINSLFVAAVVIALLYRIETIARASELFVYIASILVILTMILVSPNAKPENLQPVLEKGIVPVIKSSIVLSCFITFPLITLMMIYPANTANMPETKKSLFKGYLWAGFITFITISMTIMVLGSPITASS